MSAMRFLDNMTKKTPKTVNQEELTKQDILSNEPHVTLL